MGEVAAELEKPREAQGRKPKSSIGNPLSFIIDSFSS
jgi:hypothetical protein